MFEREMENKKLIMLRLSQSDDWSNSKVPRISKITKF
jgi:hypothetical protein